MNAMDSGVTFSAARIRSPSFSRSTSSTTKTGSPLAIAWMAASIMASLLEQPLDVLRDHVNFEVDLHARPFEAEGGHRQSARNQRNRESLRRDRNNGQADSIDGNRSLFHYIAQQLAWRVDPHQD